MNALRLGAGVTLGLVLTFLLFRIPIERGALDLWSGAFGDRFSISRTLLKTSPLLLLAVGVAISWRAGAPNIGGEGQYVIGALTAAALANVRTFAFPWIGLLAGVIGGALWAGFAAAVKRYRGVDVVLGTILLNSIALLLSGWATAYPLRDTAANLPLTRPLSEAAMLPRPDPQLDLHAGMFVTLAAFLLYALVLPRRIEGYRMDLVGASPAFARAQRLPVERIRAGALVLSGAICGLAGAIELVGVTGTMGDSFPQGWGFLAIPIALLGGRSALRLAAVALVFGALLAGSDELSRSSPVGSSLVFTAQAAALLLVLALRRKS